MNASVLNSSDPFSLLRVGEAWRNRPGLTTMLITYVAVALLLSLGSLGGTVTMVLGIFLGITVAFVGFTAAGIQFMDQAAGRVITPVLTAFIGSPMVVLRGLGLVLILTLTFFIYLAVAAIIIFVCKVPWLGAVVLTIALPVLTFLGALVFLGLTVTSLIAGAALWEGHALTAALLKGWAMATQRPMQAFLSMVILFVVVSLVALVVSGFVISGFSVVGGLSAGILHNNVSLDMSALMGTMMGSGFDRVNSGGGTIFAALLGVALIIAVMQALFTAIFAFGLSLTYLKVTEGLDIASAQSALNSAIDKTKEKAQQAAAEAKRRAHEAQVAAQQRADQVSKIQPMQHQPSVNQVLVCPKCNTPVTLGEAFCGNCGTKLV